MVLTMKETAEVFPGKKATHEVCGEVEFKYEEEFSEAPTRAKFEEQNIRLFKGTLEPIQKVLRDADLTRRDFDEIVPVGGFAMKTRSKKTTTCGLSMFVFN